MAQTILITLTIAGANTGPFDLYACSGSPLVCSPFPFDTDVQKADLQAGYLSFAVPDSATVIKVKSQGVCEDSEINLPITGTTTTTTSSTSSTTSTTTTAAVCYEFLIENVSDPPNQQVAYWTDCCTGLLACELIDPGNQITVCSSTFPYGIELSVIPQGTFCTSCSEQC